MYLAMMDSSGSVRNAETTRGGFVLVSLYSWTVFTLGILVARFVRGTWINKVRFGKDDAAILAANVRTRD